MPKTRPQEQSLSSPISSGKKKFKSKNYKKSFARSEIWYLMVRKTKSLERILEEIK